MFSVIIPCSGIGSRFASATPKQYTLLDEQSVLFYTLKAFIKLEIIEKVIICTQANDLFIDKYAKLSSKIVICRDGASTRAKTVRNALATLEASPNQWVLVHDAVRCCINEELIMRLINQCRDHAVGGILALKLNDTIKSLNNSQITTLNRDGLYSAQTPQMFRYELLKQALNRVNLDTITDEASAIENIGLNYLLVDGDSQNIKLTYPSDISLVKNILKLN